MNKTPPESFDALLKPRNPASLSYLAAGLYVVCSFIPILGFDELAFVLSVYFLYLRIRIYRDCSNGKIRREYIAAGIGYLLFFLYAMLATPFLMLLSPVASTGVLTLLAWFPLDAIYTLLVTPYLVLLDRRADRAS